MFDFLKKNSSEKHNSSDETYVEVACLLIHASKIDQNYTENEKEIINKTLKSLGVEENNVPKIVSEAEKLEADSNQILNFTRKVKDVEREKKLIIIEALWKIIYSDNNSDMYESNLMRRLTGLLYLDPKDVGDLKKKILNN